MLLEIPVANWLTLFSLIATVTAVIIAFVAHKFLRKQHRINGLLDAFNILKSREHKMSRRKVYQLNEEYKKNKDLKIFHKPQVEDVRADFYVIGSLIKSGNIDKEQFLIEFGPLAYRCWQCLKESIDDERKLRKFDPFMSNLSGFQMKPTNIGRERNKTYQKLRYTILMIMT